MAARVEFEPATFRTQGTEPITEPSRPLLCSIFSSTLCKYANHWSFSILACFIRPSHQPSEISLDRASRYGITLLDDFLMNKNRTWSLIFVVYNASNCFRVGDLVACNLLILEECLGDELKTALFILAVF